ncbi:neprosin family prolyl endopeptidase [Solirubrobacter phytolaccae]|uniref:Neprosin family prolyl endopeptidase n=1 Tax=Solirubrobacter phytolaccae TaxID=1404360 RepID=A0A9X3NLK1_9ACTN|nr:neprosin family prolyl endopeptidase [Solirubrobacter phytolaccae]MDA0183717.1 neprosin family prolyl endopeptidase [Solirubrobacter phytolaccae]
MSRAHRRLRRWVVVTSCVLGAAGAQPALAATGIGQPGYYTYYTVTPAAGTSVGVNVANGNLLVSELDLDRGDEGPTGEGTSIRRYYNSQGGTTKSGLGARWTLSTGPDISLLVTSSGQTATLSGPTGYVETLTLEDYEWVAPAGFEGYLTGSSSSRSFRRPRANAYREYYTHIFNGPAGTVQPVRSHYDEWGRDFHVAYDTIAGQQRVTHYGTLEDQAVHFAYDSAARLSWIDGYWQGFSPTPERTYSYDPISGRLNGTQLVGQTGATEYGYDANGLLNRIELPGGELVEVVYDTSGRVQQLTTTPPGQAAETLAFGYESGATLVTRPSGHRVRYHYTTDLRVTGVDNVDPGGFTCGPMVVGAPPEALDADVDEPVDGAPSTLCPPGQQAFPVPSFGPKDLPPDDEEPALGRAAADGCIKRLQDPTQPFYCWAGYRHKFTNANDEDPITGSRALISVHQQTVEAAVPISSDPQDGTRLMHTVAEIALHDRRGNVVEVGWKVDSGQTRPTMFVYHWVHNVGKGYSVGCEMAPGSPIVLEETPLPLTSATSGRTFGLRYRPASQVSDGNPEGWVAYYGTKAVCTFPTVDISEDKPALWPAADEFHDAHQADWFGEITTAVSDEPCSTMGNGVRGTTQGSARFSRVRVYRGSTLSTIPEAKLNTLSSEAVNDFYDEEKLDDGVFRYGGAPVPSCD